MAFCADDERNLLKDIEKVTRQRIPSFDRRNDKHLGAATAAMPDVGGKAERPDTRGASQPHRGKHAPKRNRNHGGGGGGGHRHEGAPARPAGEKPAFKGPGRSGNRGRGGSSGGGRSSASTGVWSNR